MVDNNFYRGIDKNDEKQKCFLKHLIKMIYLEKGGIFPILTIKSLNKNIIRITKLKYNFLNHNIHEYQIKIFKY